MAEAKARSQEKPEDEFVNSPDLSGLTPLERMAELTRRIVAVPKAEIETIKKRQAKRKHH